MIEGFKKWIDFMLFGKKTKITYTPELLSAIQQLLNQPMLGPDPLLPLKETTFVVFDTETTGFHPFAGDELISIGAAVVRNGKISESEIFHEWINPYRSIPDQVRKITLVNDDDIESAPPALVVIYQFLQFIGPHCLVAHCANFDLNFINLQLKKYCKQKILNSVIDTQTLSYHLHPKHSHSLDDLLTQYGISISHRHHALGDAIMTAQLFILLLDELERRGIGTMLGLNNYIKSMHVLLHSPSL